MARPRWAFITGSYRTASTTHYLITRDIVEETKSGKGIGYHTEKRLEEWDDKAKPGELVVCKVFKYLPQTSPWGKKFLEEGRVKALCTIRDPRDIVVSMKARGGARRPDGTKVSRFNFRDTVTNNFPIWLGQMEKWIDLGPEITMVTRYEEFILNLYKEAKRIADHLGIDADDDLLKSIAKKYAIQALIKTKKRFREDKKDNPGLREDPWLPSIPGIKFGTFGHWRTWLSTGEVTMVEKHCRKFMERFGYS